MLKTTFLFCSLFVGILNAQTFEEINKPIFEKEFLEEANKENTKGILKFYNCLKKNYNYDYKKDSLFDKEIQPKETDNYLSNTPPYNASFYYLHYNSSYEIRLEYQKAYKKCINKKDIDW